MRIGSDVLQKIENRVGEFTVEPYTEAKGLDWIQSGLFFRFGYWNRIDPDDLASMLPNGTKVTERYIDETDEGMQLWAYECSY